MKTPIKTPKLLAQNLLVLQRSGKYDAAMLEINEIWEDTTKTPDVESLESRDAAEIILRCGSLFGFLGHDKQISGSQEKSKNLLTEARNRFLNIYDIEKIAECENYLALAYWRTGEFLEAENWIEEAFSHKLADSNNTYIHSYLIKSQIYISQKKYVEAVKSLTKIQPIAEKYANDSLNGSICTNLGVAFRNLNKFSESINFYKLAQKYHQRSGHQIYLGTVENNLANVYKCEHNFVQAHQSVDKAIKIYEKINDKTRKGSSLDTKSSIYFDEGKYEKALSTIDESIKILRKGENAAYLVESILTKAKILVFLDDIASASICLSEGIQIAKINISENAAKNLGIEFELAIRKKTLFTDYQSEKKIKSENLELVLHSSLSHYENYQAIRIKNNYLSEIGLSKDYLAIVVKEKVNNGDLVALNDLTNDSFICGFYEVYFGTVSISGIESEPILFNEEDVKILGKIVGAGNPEKLLNEKIIVEPVDLSKRSI